MLATVPVLAIPLVGCTRPRNDGPVVIVDGEDDGWSGTRVETPYEIPTQSLTDTSGQSYNLATSPATPITLVFFGYTHCPDVCITVMSDLAVALKRSDVRVQDRVTVAFVTTDPARDDEQTIREWLDLFDPSFVGLTGDLDVIKDMAEQLGVVVEGMKELPSGGYEVGHSAQVIGMQQDQGGVIVWTPSTPSGDLREDLARLVEQT